MRAIEQGERVKEERSFDRVRRDLERYFELESRDGAPRLGEKLAILLDSPGLQSVLVYRFGSWVHRRVSMAVVRLILKVVHAVLRKLCVIAYGIEIDAKAEIGGGLYVGHQSGVVVGRAKIGSDCNIAHNVTIGGRVDGRPGLPVLGDRVWIGTGSVLFGAVVVGDGVTVGPLTVVSRSVAPSAMVMGNPMRVVQTDHDNSAEIYGRRRPDDVGGSSTVDAASMQHGPRAVQVRR